ncbi:MAG TPA: M14 family metallopeptidase, partial [Vicinamibacteria bacterium]
TYDETLAFLRRLAAESPDIHLVSLGRSPEGREVVMVVATRTRPAEPAALRASGKPILLAQGGIHSGEIDGKDAGLMLLRDIARGKKKDLLAGAHLLFVPILNVDGHERRSPYGRINQRGPQETGWRTTARNLNLNRDYAKLDAPETRAVVKAMNEWDPDLYLDLHVTDGADYQYDITFGWNGRHSWSPAQAGWLDTALKPALDAGLRAAGHIPGALVFPADDADFGKGLIEWTASPRLSTGYGDARHLATVLVENHSLKPYKQRVLGTYVLLEGTLGVLARDGAALRAAAAQDRGRHPAQVPIDWKLAPDRAGTVEFAGIESRTEPSQASGGPYPVWTGRPARVKLPQQHMSAVAASVSRPKAYWIPPAWPEVVERLEAHGIQVSRLSAPLELSVEAYRLVDPKLAAAPFEGRVGVTAGVAPERRRLRLPAGSVRVATDQPLGELAVLLLEPASPDSFFQWGFFLEVLQPTEYAEAYIMAPMAEAMLREDPALRAEFEKKVASDPEFAKSPRDRLQWFYAHTPFFDPAWRVYPVVREP